MHELPQKWQPRAEQHRKERGAVQGEARARVVKPLHQRQTLGASTGGEWYLQEEPQSRQDATEDWQEKKAHKVITH